MTSYNFMRDKQC